MRTYLAVPFDEKDEAKRLGARWDPDLKKWYAPNGEISLLERWPIKSLIEIKGEDRRFGGNELFIELTIIPHWASKVRYWMSPDELYKFKEFIFGRSNFQCECCGFNNATEIRERWHFNNSSKTQKLMRLMALCELCYEVTYLRFINSEHEKLLFDHLMKTREISQEGAKKIVKGAFYLWKARKQFVWDLDLGILIHSDIKLSGGVKYILEKLCSG